MPRRLVSNRSKPKTQSSKRPGCVTFGVPADAAFDRDGESLIVYLPGINSNARVGRLAGSGSEWNQSYLPPPLPFWESFIGMPKSKKPLAHVETTSLGIAGEMHRVVWNASLRQRASSGAAYATFQLIGDLVEPEFWNAYFGLLPSEFHRKGESVAPDGADISPSGRPCARHKSCVWSLTSRGQVVSDDLDPHLRYLIDMLALPRPDFADLLARHSLISRMFCFWENPDGGRVPVVAERLHSILKTSAIALEIDEYPQQIWTMKDGKKVKAWI